MVIRSLCASYLSPFGRGKSKHSGNKIARFVSLLQHPSPSLKERLLVLLACLIMESPPLIGQQVQCGLTRNIKAMMRDCAGDQEVLTRIFMIVSGSAEHRLLVMEEDLWIPLIENLAATQDIDEQQRNHIVKGTSTILSAYEESEDADIDLVTLAREQIGSLRANKAILESNTDLIKTLCRL